MTLHPDHPFTSELRGILFNTNIGDLEQGDLALGSKIGDEGVEQLVLAIKSLILNELPRKKWRGKDWTAMQIQGHNSCLSQVKERLEIDEKN